MATKDMTPDELRAMSKQLMELAAGYSSLADRMDKGEVKGVEESGRATFIKITIPSIKRNIRRIAGRLDVLGV